MIVSHAKLLQGLVIIVLFSSVVFAKVYSHADTITLNDGTEVKGLILKDFKDRIIISTPAGEKSLLKEEVRGASYSDDVRAMLHKARNKVKSGEYGEAYSIYSDVLKEDPDNEEAYVRMEFLERLMRTRSQRNIENRIESFNISFGREGYKTTHEKLKEFYKSMLARSDAEKYVKVKSIKDDAPGGLEGIDLLKSGDRIISIWGEDAAYMGVEDVADFLAGNRENRIEIERSALVRLKDMKKGLVNIVPVFLSCKNVIGAAIDITRGGAKVLMVYPYGPFDNADIAAGDVLCRVGGKDVAYMPIRKLTDLICRNQGKPVVFAFRRDITLWSEN